MFKNDEFEKKKKMIYFQNRKMQLKLAIDIQKELQNKLICFGNIWKMYVRI